LTTLQTRPLVPIDLATVESLPDWRRTLAWPLSHEQRYDAVRGQMRSLISFACELPDNLRDIVLLGSQAMVHNVRALTELALALHHADSLGMQVAGGRPELAYMRGETETPRLGESPPPLRDRPGNRWVRRIARTASWTPWWRLPGACLFPTAVAVTHNSLLRDAARTSGERVGFRHADSWLEQIRTRARNVTPVEGLGDLAVSLAKRLATVEGLEEVLRQRLGDLIALHARRVLRQAAKDLAALKACKDIPRRLWAGSGGYYPVRALSLEVLRRGGTVRRFDHGGANGFTTEEEGVAFSEMTVSTEYVTATPEVARMSIAVGTERLVESFRKVEIYGHKGDPAFRRAATLLRQQAGPRRKVVYVPTALIGFRQLYPPLLPDAVSLDWQLRLAETLAELPVEFLCRPHPEGHHPGDRHPLSRIAPLAGGSFEEVMAMADLFVFDYPLTTTFWQCLCTDVPMVFLNMEVDELTSTARALIERRCQVIPVTYDERNLPQLDREQLADAVVEGSGTADPSEFRRLLAGEE
jgi:hypothetical protein